MSTEVAADPALRRLADAILIPPFPGRRPPSWVLGALRGGLAGVTVFGPNIDGAAQLGSLIARLRDSAAEPVIAIDEEGGDVTRVAHRAGSPYPGNAALGAVDDVDVTRAVYRALGAELARLGVNLNLAPSVDVNTAADNPVIGTRSFGSDPQLVARHAAAAVAGLQSAGVAACAKHFPGHGSTSNDTHHAVATVDAPMSLLASRDLPPFVTAIAAGVRAVMPGHLRVPELTGDLPASLSPAAQTGLLRGDLGFTGVIVSDALEMRAVSEPYGLPEAAVLAVAAGTDLLCFGRDQDEHTYLAVRAALMAAVAAGRLPGRRLEEAADRVAQLRTWSAAARQHTGVAPLATPPDSAPPVDGTAQLGTAPLDGTVQLGTAPLDGTVQLGTAPLDGTVQLDGEAVGLAAARRAVQVTGTPGRLIRPVLVELVPPANIAVGAVPWGLADWVAAGDALRISTGSAAGELAAAVGSAVTRAAGRPLMIVVRDAHRHPAARQAVNWLLAARPDAVVIEMGLPVWRPPAAVYLATYGAARSSSQAAAEILGLTQPAH